MSHTLTLRVSGGHPDVVATYDDVDTAVRVLKACTDLPNNGITGWSISDDEPSVLVYTTETPAPLDFPPTTHGDDTYGMCTACGAVEVRLYRPNGFRDLSGNGGHPAYPIGHGCELCD